MKNYPIYKPAEMVQTKYLFFTGKGGVGKTSVACATAVQLADQGKSVFLISTDPASNLQDVFETTLDNKGVLIKEVPNLVVANLNPEEAAAEYRESVVGPYRRKMPESVIASMEEQLSGSCTVEIASFNEFAHFITDKSINDAYDIIIFDTAPTGHTLRMLELPSAWDSFIDESTHGASCLGQLSGLGDKKEMYAHAVKTLSDPQKTTLLLVTRPEKAPLEEAARASGELFDIGVKHQGLIINGLLMAEDKEDPVARAFYEKQQQALEVVPAGLQTLKTTMIPLRSYNIGGIANIRDLLVKEKALAEVKPENSADFKALSALIEDLYHKKKRVIFTMGKGGGGKTTTALLIAKGLAERGEKVHLTTTDPAGYITTDLVEEENITISNIDEALELEKYKTEVLKKAMEGGASKEDIDYIEEDLRSPCTQEIASFRAFAEIVEKS
ncbi:MAG: TRC40/GET3/ArsA family transport-energizing ATPase, partial [Eubacterium sp.]